MDLAVFFYALTGFAVLMYVVMDGFDLGVGLLLPFARDSHERERMVASIVPFWDGNETWLVYAGVLLFAAFPSAYASLLPMLYTPLFVMLLGLILRGVAFEFRYKTRAGRAIWDRVFALGSLLAATGQGLALGAYIENLPASQDPALSPFALIVAAGLLSGYALLAATWLVMKTHGALQARARRWAEATLFLVALALAGVTVATPLANPALAARWFSLPTVLWLAPLPLLCVGLLMAIQRRLSEGEQAPFYLAIGVFMTAFAGLVASHFPLLAPGLDLWQAASGEKSLRFLAVGVALLMPVILGYTAFGYRVFRGKVREGHGY